jgi:hypothetical protein
MKMKKNKSKNKEVAKGSSPAVAPVTDNNEKVTVKVTESQFPPPHYLLQEAKKVINRNLIEEYIETINVLRDDKGYSFREIADWLTENGVEADYNAVYRAYTSGMSGRDAAQIAQLDEHEDRVGKAE